MVIADWCIWIVCCQYCGYDVVVVVGLTVERSLGHLVMLLSRMKLQTYLPIDADKHLRKNKHKIDKLSDK